MSTQLALSDDIQPRRFRSHEVWKRRTPAPEVQGPALPFGNKPASIFEVPIPMEEPRKARVTGVKVHQCGICRKFSWCANISRCTLAMRTPCGPCEQAVEASYRAGRYASR